MQRASFFLLFCAFVVLGAYPAFAQSGQTPWLPVEQVEPNPGDASVPNVFRDPAGNALAVWWQENSPSVFLQDIRYSFRSAAGGAWSAPKNLRANIAGGLEVKMTYDPARRQVLAAWIEYDFQANRSRVAAAAFDVRSQRWSRPAFLDAAVPDAALAVRVALDGRGEGTAVWMSFAPGVSGANRSMYAAYYSSRNQTWSAAERVQGGIEHANPNGGGGWEVDFSLNASGEGMAVYTHYDGARERVFSIPFSTPDVWGGPLKILPSPEDAWVPRVAMNADGEAIAVWEQGQNPHLGGNDVWYSFYTQEYGPGWSPAEPVDPTSPPGANPRVAEGAGGGIMLVYDRETYCQNPDSLLLEPRQQVWAARWKSEPAGWFQLQQISPCTARLPDLNGGFGEALIGSAFRPSIASTLDGDAAVVWRQGGANPNLGETWAALYDEAVYWHPPFRLSTAATGGLNGRSQVAISPGGEATAVWYQPDTTGMSLYSRTTQ